MTLSHKNNRRIQMFQRIFFFIISLVVGTSPKADIPLALYSVAGSLPVQVLQLNIEITSAHILTQFEAKFHNPHADILHARLRFAMPNDAAPGSFRVVERVPLREQIPPAAPPSTGGFDEVLLIDKTQHVILAYRQNMPRRQYYFPLRGLETAALHINIKGADKLHALPPGFNWERTDNNSLMTHITPTMPLTQDLVFNFPPPQAPAPQRSKAVTELKVMQEKTEALTQVRDDLHEILTDNRRMSASNRDLHHELQDTRSQLQEVETQLRTLLEMQKNLLDHLEQELTAPSPPEEAIPLE
jgi:hypothetical protein